MINKLAFRNAMFFASLLLSFFSCFSVVSLSEASLEQNKNKTLLPEGTEVKVKLNKRLSSRSSRSGESIQAEIFENLVFDQKVLIKKGTKVNGFLTDVRRAERLGQEGTLSLVLTSTRTIDNQKVDLRASQDSRGKDTIASTVALSLLVSPLFLLRKGKDITIPNGKVFSAFVGEDVYVSSSLLATEENLPETDQKQLGKEKKNKSVIFIKRTTK